MNGGALLDYVKRGIVPSAPETVHIDVSSVCDQGCITCWTHSPEALAAGVHGNGPAFMSALAFREIVYDCANSGVTRLIISGSGEPFLHPEIDGMVRYAKTNNLHTTVITNGQHIDSGKLLVSRPDRLLVNFCASNPDSYARFYTGRKSSQFVVFIEKLKALAREIPVTLAVVVSGVNIHELTALCMLAREIPGARLSFKLATFTDRTRRFSLSGDALRTLVDTIIPECRVLCDKTGVPHNLDSFIVRFCPQAGSVMNDGRTDDRSEELKPIAVMETGCFAGALYSRIHVNGDVSYCCEHIHVGTVSDRSFLSVWRSAEYDAVRDRLARGRFFPGCADCGKFNLNLEARRLVDRCAAETCGCP